MDRVRAIGAGLLLLLFLVGLSACGNRLPEAAPSTPPAARVPATDPETDTEQESAAGAADVAVGAPAAATSTAPPPSPTEAPSEAEVVLLPTPTPEGQAPDEPANAADDASDTVVLLPTPTPEAPPAEPTSPPDWTTTATMDGDYYVLGNPNAPIRLLDYSDFL